MIEGLICDGTLLDFMSQQYFCEITIGFSIIPECIEFTHIPKMPIQKINLYSANTGLGGFLHIVKLLQFIFKHVRL